MNNERYDFSYIANALGELLHKDENKFVFLRTCVGAGKTSMSLVHMFLLAHMQEPNRDGVRHTKTCIVRATAPNLKNTTIPSFINWFGKIATLKIGNAPYTAEVIMPSMFGDGTTVKWEILFLGLDHADAVEKLKSLEVSNILFSEAVEIRKVMFDTAKGRIGRFPPTNSGCKCTRPQILCEYNSPSIDHWLAQLELNAPPEHSFHVGPPAVLRTENGEYKVNPKALNLENLPDGYYQNQIYGSEQSYINVMLMNKFGTLKSEKPVFSNYNDEVHCATEELKPLRGIPLVVGLDLGLTPACAIGQLTPSGQLIILDEITEFDTSLDAFLEERFKPLILSKYYGFEYKVVVDPAGNQRAQTDLTSCVDLLKKHGIPVKTAKSNSLIDRLGAVDYFLRRMISGKTPSFLLSPACTSIRKGMISEYHYERVKSLSSDMYNEKPAKNEYSHVMDALQYLALDCQAPNITKTYKNYSNNSGYQPGSSVGGY